jgi:hypothetical protein
MDPERLETVIRLLKRRPVSHRTATMAIELIEQLAHALSMPKGAPTRSIPREDTDSGGNEAVEEDDIIVNADRLADPSKRR